MNIFYDHQIFSIQKYGGLSRYIYELLVRMIKSEFDISLFAGFSLNRYGIEDHRKEFKKFWSYVYNEVPKTKMMVFDVNSFVMNFFARSLSIDIYHQTYYAPLLKNYKGKRIVTMLDMTHELYPESFSKHDKTVSWKKESISIADSIICISESTKNDLVNMYGYDENKARVIYLGNSIDKTDEKINIGKPFILFVGVRRGYKNFEVLLNAYNNSEKLKNDFNLVCFGGGNFTEDEKNIIKKYGLIEKIVQDSGDDKKLAKYYNSASVFVYPSKYEGFGIPPLEAMSIGCPVIAGNKSSIPEVVGNGGILFNPDSDEELKYNLEKLLYDDELREKYINAGYEQSKKFSWDKCAEETIEFYKELC